MTSLPRTITSSSMREILRRWTKWMSLARTAWRKTRLILQITLVARTSHMVVATSHMEDARSARSIHSSALSSTKISNAHLEPVHSQISKSTSRRVIQILSLSRSQKCHHQTQAATVVLSQSPRIIKQIMKTPWKAKMTLQVG